MFTGIVEHTAPLISISRRGPGAVLAVANPWPTPPEDGESICVSGACLTVVSANDRQILFDLSEETLEKTTLSRAVPGRLVNLERSLRAGDDVSGHFVTGHVDGVGRVVELRRKGPFARLRVSVPNPLLSQLAPKGSVAVDGVSLTIADTEGDSFAAALIPETLARTNLDRLSRGDSVNIETDVLAKYVARCLALRQGVPSGGSVTLDQLAEMGY
ncbi:MAG: riboflavin synthase [Planctomycetota bacterium]|jgi:riboflavin synthase